MRRLLVTGVLLAATQTAMATDVYRWVDDNGVTHFSDAALAHSHAEAQKVGAANAMDVPDASSLNEPRRKASFRKISKAGKKNKDGWRGYQRNNNRSGGRRSPNTPRRTF